MDMMAMMMAFEDAAREWNELLRDTRHATFAQQHADAILQLAAALACAQDAESAVDHDTLSKLCTSKDHEQMLLSVAFAVKRLLLVVVRERMHFLLPEHQTSPSDDASASQRDTLAQQQALLLKIPSAFRHQFLQTLRDHWDAFEQTAVATKFSLPRLTDMRWSIASPGTVVLRIQTSDNASRTLQVPMRQFHKLRYSAAKVLQEMNTVEAHPILRLTRTEQQRRGNAATNAP